MISGLSVPIHSHIVYVMPSMCRDIPCKLLFAICMSKSSAHLKYDVLLNMLVI